MIRPALVEIILNGRHVEVRPFPDKPTIWLIRACPAVGHDGKGEGQPHYTEAQAYNPMQAAEQAVAELWPASA